MQDSVSPKIHITALYTQTARQVSFVAEPDQTVQHVVDEAYRKLGESHREGDQYFCRQEPRIDLAPYLNSTLHALQAHGVCLQTHGHGELEFAFDIDAKPGGAA